ncbi:FAD-binding oxidoreductase [uncultured Paracoccus sp.]|uniref:NAD(P)/FAD-dependent oxidoreductase n=1 Tax=uncultured Paracoccus sp. TaxID=189685 RepID=UPI0025D20C91|nr:FAD-binding oxidoreductase [uncultured Paracoccus sp.]
MSDIVVIGGGIAGVSAAAELSHLGRVTLLEAEDALASHASGRSAALYEPAYGPPAILELSRLSGPGLADAGVLSPRGMMLVAAVGADRGFDAERDQMGLQEIDPDRAVTICPGLDPARIARAAHSTAAQDIDTDLLIQTHARAARSRGAQILTGAGVTAISRSCGRWHLRTKAGEHAAPLLVNAAGAWADRIAEMAGVRPLGLQPHRRSVARIAMPQGVDVSRWPMLMGLGESWYAKPDAGALIVSPADAEPVPPHDAWADDMVLAEGLARYAEVARHPVRRMLANWAGLRTFAPDGSPAYGRDAGQPDFVWFAGQGGYGFQSSAAAARFIADTVAGRPTDARLAALMDPARFSR